MEVIELSSKQYNDIFNTPFHVFNKTEFNALNEDKTDEVYYLAFKDKKFKLGIIGGIRNSTFNSPFSAPFGGFTYTRSDVKINTIEEALQKLIEWAEAKKISSLKIVLPPSIYSESFISKQVNTLYRAGFLTDNIDLNYSLSLNISEENYKNRLWRNARNKLNIALKNNLSFEFCQNREKKELAYNIIKENRECRGFPLRMSWQQVEATIEVIAADFFLVKNEEEEAIASAIVFHVSNDIVQVIYWGDLPEYAHLKTMNFLSFNVFSFYKGKGKKIVDIGPSTENSVPNFGLCEFKESIGCDISVKHCFVKKIE